jgi:hypothetical protein
LQRSLRECSSGRCDKGAIWKPPAPWDDEVVDLEAVHQFLRNAADKQWLDAWETTGADNRQVWSGPIGEQAA